MQIDLKWTGSFEGKTTTRGKPRNISGMNSKSRLFQRAYMQLHIVKLSQIGNGMHVTGFASYSRNN